MLVDSECPGPRRVSEGLVKRKSELSYQFIFSGVAAKTVESTTGSIANPSLSALTRTSPQPPTSSSAGDVLLATDDNNDEQ